ncbi:MAG: ATP-binding cassette domain-containing protein [Sphingomicrobium sp.]
MTDDVPLLDISDASVMRGERLILDRLTLTIGQGQHTAILGPNGSGKSTLIGMLSRQLHPLYGGRVAVLGQERMRIADLRPLIGLVSPALQADLAGDDGGRLTAFSAVAASFFGMRGLWDKQPDPEMVRRTDQALESVGAASLRDRELWSLSTGEARRVLIARALVHRPRALMLDEPCQGLDPGSRRRFLEDLRRLARSGTTLVMVTHHIEEVIPEIGQLILLKEGRLMAAGHKEDLLTDPLIGALFDSEVRIRRSGDDWHWANFSAA